jgi:hypothetical protein
MKEILTTSISSTVGLPLLGRTIDFIRDNITEQTSSLAYSELNSSDDSLPIVLYGCIGTYSTVGFTNDTYIITKGAILYQGEIYQVPAMVATRANIGETIVFKIDNNTFQSGEPTLYTDGASRNTNLDRTIKIYNGSTGSGIVDAVNIKFLNRDLIDEFSGVNGRIYSSISAVNAIITNYIISGIKKQDLITITGNILITHTAGSPKPIITLTPSFYWESKKGYVAPITLVNQTTGTASTTITTFDDFTYEIPMINTVGNGNTYIYHFNFTYKAKNIG